MLNSVLNGDWSNSVPGWQIPEGTYPNSGLEKIPISPWLVTLLHICEVIPTPQWWKLRASADIALAWNISPCRVPMSPSRAPISQQTSHREPILSHQMASVLSYFTMFKSVSQCFSSGSCCFSSGSWCFTCVSQCYTSFSWRFTMFNNVLLRLTMFCNV